jgi:hypothetical protein
LAGRARTLYEDVVAADDVFIAHRVSANLQSEDVFVPHNIVQRDTLVRFYSIDGQASSNASHQG